MQTVKDFEVNIKGKTYANAGSARAGVSRSSLSKSEKNRLHTLIEDVYNPLIPKSNDVHTPEKKIRTIDMVSAYPVNLLNTRMLDKLAIHLCIYAGRTGVTYDQAVAQLRDRVKTLGIDG